MKWKPTQTLSSIKVSHLIFLVIIFRIPFLLLRSPIYDLITLYWDGQFLLNGDIPYRDANLPIYLEHAAGVHLHPVGYYYFYSFLVFISGKNIIVFNYIARLFWNSFDIISAYGLYLISKKYFSQTKAKIIFLLYAFNPFSSYFINYFGFDESLIQMIMIFSVFFFIEKKYLISSILLGIGTAHIIMPIFFLIVFIPYFLAKKEYLKMVLYSISNFSVFIILSLPMYLMAPSSFIEGFINVFQREQAATLCNTLLFGFILKPIFSFSLFSINISITIKLFFQLLILVILFIFLLTQFMTRKINIISGLFLLFLLMPLATFTVHIRLYYWAVPYFLLFFLEKDVEKIYLSKFDNLTKRYIILNSITLGSILINQIFIWSSINPEVQSEMFGWYRYFFIQFLVYFIIWTLLAYFNQFQRYISKQFSIILLFDYFSFFLVLFNQLGILSIYVYFVSIILVTFTLIIGFKAFKQDKGD